MCLVVPNPLRLIIPKAALASPHASPNIFQPKSCIIDISPKISADAFEDAYNSLSPELSATRVWFLRHVLIMLCPGITQPPVVDLRVPLQPAQSASENVFITVGAVCHWNTCCILGRLFKYLPNRLSCAQLPLVGLAIFLARSQTLYEISGLSGLR